MAKELARLRRMRQGKLEAPAQEQEEGLDLKELEREKEKAKQLRRDWEEGDLV